jgi:Mn2+/Fe2+ NRAMP family transporter
VKVAIQLEFGKRAILSGETPMKSFSKLPGPAFGKGKWTVWIVFILTLLKVIQVGGMLGGSAIVLAMLFPAFSISTFLVILALVVSVLVFRNYYKLVEKSSLVMVAAFTILTIVSLIAVFFTPFRISLAEFMSGLEFRLPSEVVIFAIGAFGITGVASDEIIAYNYWCIEKGYAAYTGPADNSSSRRERAKGWIKVMILDASVAMVIYTIVTAAFYLLGASILHNREDIPEGNALIGALANIYTESLGEGVRIAYLVGAFFVLFSSVFATLAYWTRLFSDIFGQLGWMDFSNPVSRKKTIAALAWIFPVLWTVTYLFMELPVLMILSGGLVGSLLLLLVVFAALCFRYKMTEQSIKPGIMYDLLLWTSVLSILAVAVYGLIKLFLFKDQVI